MTYIPYLRTFFSHGTPVWPWPVISLGKRPPLANITAPQIVKDARQSRPDSKRQARDLPGT